MSLFQTSVIKKYLSNLSPELIDKKYKEFQSYFGNAERQENIRNSKEEEYQSGFISALFVNILGYTLNPEPNFNIVLEKKNVDDSKKADGAIIKENEVIAVIELKSTQTTNLDSFRDQAFGYKNHNPKCVYVITSNFEKIRIYIHDTTNHQEFDLFNLNKEDFALLWLCFSKDNILNDIPLKIKEASVLQEENITKKLYHDYSKFRKEIFNDIVKNNPEFDKLVLFKKTQKLLDRFLFIFFAEDKLLLPPNSISEIVKQWTTLKDDLDEYVPLYDRFKKYFGYLNTGFKGKKYDVFAYNGGLFLPDEILDNIKIDDEILRINTVQLSTYDFETDVDVNILGHIFEHSLGEIENVQAEIAGEEIDTQKTKRKKDGIFYTPKYITKYIVENTVGKLCEEKRIEFEIIDEEYAKGRKNRKKEIVKDLDNKLIEYREWLLNITILDPACGSGAFLNQALEFLIQEHTKIDELKAQLLGGSIVFPDIEAKILEKNIYGVDLNEESVEIAKLSLWLRTAQKGRKLTTLSNHIKCGNSLIDDKEIAGEKAFNWENEFPHVFANGGFDIVIGNPPYVRQELLPKTEKDYFTTNYKVGNGTADLYVYFYEKAITVLKNNGLLGFITPNKFYKTKYGKELREFIINYSIIKLIDFFELKVFEDASTDSQILILEKNNKPTDFKYSPIKNIQDFREDNHNPILINPKNLSSDIWVFNTGNELSILNKMKNNSISLLEYSDNNMYRGIITGLNEAFIIDEETKNKIIVDDPKSAELIKPYIAPTEIKRYHLGNLKKLYFINTYYDLDITEYKGIYNWLLSFDEKLRKRQDKGFHHFNLRACKYYDKFDVPKIVYIYTAVNHNFYYDEEGYYINNSSYMITNVDKFLSAWLNSKIFLFYKKLNFVAYGDSSGKGRVKLDYNKMVNVPIPIVSDETKSKFDTLVNFMLDKSKEQESKKTKFIGLLLEHFKIEKISQKLENFYDFEFKTFLAELSKQKIKLSLTEQTEWKDFFEKYKIEISQIQIEIRKNDNEINRLVYELYSLTPEEIKFIEKSC